VLKAYRIDHQGVSASPVLSPLNMAMQTDPMVGNSQMLYEEMIDIMSWAGTITSNHQGNKLVITDPYNPIDSLKAVYLVDFENSTGVADNVRVIDQENGYRTCFSLNDSLLYVGGYQYEVYHSTPETIQQSRFYLGFGASSS